MTNLFSPTLVQSKVFNCFINVEHELAHQWHASGNFFCGGAYGLIRSVNINAPLVAAVSVSLQIPRRLCLRRVQLLPDENLMSIKIPATYPVMPHGLRSASTVTSGLACRQDICGGI